MLKKATAGNENQSDGLTCPITLETFRDPVRAADGHVYERQAITKWVEEHGTSPLTRQPLSIADLRSDHQIKKLSDIKRQASVSSDPIDDIVTISSISSTITAPYSSSSVSYSYPRPSFRSHVNNRHSGCSQVNVFAIFLTSFLIPSGFIAGLVQGLKSSYSPTTVVTSYYFGQAFNNSVYINRSNSIYYFTTVNVTFSTTGFYGFQIQGDNAISVDGDLYVNSFDYNNISVNLQTYVYKDKNYTKTLFGNKFPLKNYVLMLTTYYPNLNFSFFVSVTGPSDVSFS